MTSEIFLKKPILIFLGFCFLAIISVTVHSIVELKSIKRENEEIKEENAKRTYQLFQLLEAKIEIDEENANRTYQLLSEKVEDLVAEKADSKTEIINKLHEVAQKNSEIEKKIEDALKMSAKFEKLESIVNNTSILVSEMSEEKTRRLAVSLGRERGIGAYLDTDCDKRPSFSTTEIKHILYLISKGYTEVNFEFDENARIKVSSYGWSLVYASKTLKIKHTDDYKRVDVKCQTIGYSYGQADNSLYCRASWTGCTKDLEDGYQTFHPKPFSTDGASIRFNLNIIQ